ncbi:MAG: hypothetical protein O2923_04485 [Verrucomicrobia bacterium]|nr:hypothetical protein [Verrucomicrobiota bacterium]MDA1086609.1 hypothetical protein [Verrucomicrobiota bacterium]
MKRFCDNMITSTGGLGLLRGTLALSALIVLSVAIALIVGCETSQEGDPAIAIVPRGVSLVGGSQTVILTAIGRPDIEDQTIDPVLGGVDEVAFSTNTTLFLPLEWTVRFPHLGFIADAQGFTAIYISTDQIGQQIINVRDQRFSSGVAVVDQIDPATLIDPNDTNAPAATTP